MAGKMGGDGILALLPHECDDLFPSAPTALAPAAKLANPIMIAELALATCSADTTTAPTSMYHLSTNGAFATLPTVLLVSCQSATRALATPPCMSLASSRPANGALTTLPSVFLLSCFAASQALAPIPAVQAVTNLAADSTLAAIPFVVLISFLAASQALAIAPTMSIVSRLRAYFANAPIPFVS